MSTPYVGEIRAFGFTFQPAGWLLCNGQSLAISEYSVLFNLIGTTYGGNGTTTFNLPNLTTVLGQPLGSPNVTLSVPQMPAHNHTITMGVVPSGGTVLTTAVPSPTTYLADANLNSVYNTAPTLNATLAASTIGLAGGSQPHENTQPYQVISFCIAWAGIYPSQT
jgi:microcystin-dependent protein